MLITFGYKSEDMKNEYKVSYKFFFENLKISKIYGHNLFVITNNYQQY